MAITGYRPSTDLLNPMLEEFFRTEPAWGGRMGGLRAPDADVVESENEIRVVVELPGVTANDLELNLENNVLTISGEKKEQRQEQKDIWHLSERRYGTFSRSFVLPRDVEQEKIHASFDNGVLNVVIPKSEKARRRRIEVQNGGNREVQAGSGTNQQ